MDKFKYIHIGYPKCFSTSLQRTFFPKHPSLIHLGTGTSDNNIGYLDKEIEHSLEVYLKYAKRPFYLTKREKIISCYERWFERLQESSDKLAVGISSEHLCFSFTSDSLSFMEKADRLHDIFQGNTKIIILLRNQKDLIQSLYKESIRVGYFKTYSEYLDDLYKFQERNFFYDLCYDKVVSYYQDLFGVNNVGVFFFENHVRNKNLIVKGSNYTVIEAFCDFLNVPLITSKFGHFNKARNNSELEKKRILNQQIRHDLGKSFYSSVEQHRLKSYWIDVLKLEVTDSEIYRDVLIKRRLIDASIGEKDKVLDMAFSESLRRKIFFLYNDSNKKLQKIINQDLPMEYFYYE